MTALRIASVVVLQYCKYQSSRSHCEKQFRIIAICWWRLLSRLCIMKLPETGHPGLHGIQTVFYYPKIVDRDERPGVVGAPLAGVESSY